MLFKVILVVLVIITSVFFIMALCEALKKIIISIYINSIKKENIPESESDYIRTYPMN